MFKRKRADIDRRSGEDRRQNHEHAKKLFADSRTDPRKGVERRAEIERRSGWIRINQWSSIKVSF